MLRCISNYPPVIQIVSQCYLLNPKSKWSYKIKAYNCQNISPDNTQNSPANWRQEDSINHVDHLKTKNWNIHAESRPVIVRIK